MEETRGLKVARLLGALYLLEAGLLLALAPWSPLWLHRVVLPSPETVRGILASPWFRGFIAGVGILHVAAGLSDLVPRRRPAAAA